MSDTWNPEFINLSPLFQTVADSAKEFTFLNEWPTLQEYQKIFRESCSRITPVAQAEKFDRFEDQYEPRVFLKGELQTRLNNWHDFFNALIWLRFPKIKSTLNELHYYSALQRDEKTNRSKLENAITLFDECGAIIISSREDLLQMIRDHEWKRLFIEHRGSFINEIKCFVFGHAMYEKALNPYIGMTVNAILICSDELLNSDFGAIDDFVAQYWKQFHIQSTKDLQPFPLLGMPGWHTDNDNELFYEDKDYFRPKRTQATN